MMVPIKQRGGKVTVNGLLLTLLILASLASNAYQYMHRVVQIPIVMDETPQRMMLPKTAIQATSDADYGVIHIFPPGQEVCSAFDNICYTKI